MKSLSKIAGFHSVKIDFHVLDWKKAFYVNSLKIHFMFFEFSQPLYVCDSVKIIHVSFSEDGLYVLDWNKAFPCEFSEFLWHGCDFLPSFHVSFSEDGIHCS